MGEIQEVQLQIKCQESKDVTAAKTGSEEPTSKSTTKGSKDYNWWFRVTVYAFLLISGQSVATLLGELYYDKGGNSKWMATFVQSSGFPVLFIPLIVVKIYLTPPTSSTTTITTKPSASVSTLALLYISLGVLIAGNGMLYSYGLLYLPVSTYSLLCATQLVFNAIFSFVINSQKFTAFIFNSLILLTMSVVLLAIDPGGSSDSKAISGGKYAIGFICTLSASAGYSLLLSLTQLSFEKVIKKSNHLGHTRNVNLYIGRLYLYLFSRIIC